MASEAPKGVLPVMYNDLEPITKEKHGKLKMKSFDKMPFAAKIHAVPVTVEEIPLLQRHFPIVFTTGDNMLPIALMGLNEGANAFFDAEGNLLDKSVYLPAYLRRYPFMLARLKKDSDELSLVVDPTSDVFDEKDGDPLFDGDQPSQRTQDILKFCEQFETSAQRTGVFVDELKKLDLMMDGEVAIQPDGMEKPYLYRGFRMVDEKKFRELKGDQLRKMNQSGMLPIIVAHLFSLGQIRDVFARQVRAGKGPVTVEELEGKKA
ncbi:SapC family protein [Sphingomicrobium astaxanthinifaciens]|uniref:SapC family protein n=1 Tax=Sphingomicrobium astaxanthinifaciens TaxID=1227949 RepID=UPI001FCB3851|nr:SapC family protein [Sphingomicrobium astaxanthinifaciens]MCJ7420594.1 SapC family protein [Sphingomicrobium astaxanthinifaciens]